MAVVLGGISVVIALVTEVRSGREIFYFGFFAVCGLLMSLSLATLYLTFRHAHKRHVQAEAERAELEAKYLQAQKMEAIGRLAGRVAHDFNNQMTIVLGCGETVLKRLEENDPKRTMIVEMQKAAKRASHLTRQLLTFSRKQVLQSKPVSLNDVLAEIKAALARMIREDIELSVETADDLGWSSIDRSYFEHAIMNLVINARDAMPDGGKLTIRTANVDLDAEFVQTHPGSVQGPHVVLEVTDTGTGMGPETVMRVFEPFFTTKKIGEGTGLGLSMVFGLVKQSGGYIYAQSEPGRGTTFRILLPRIEAAPEEPQAQTETPRDRPAGQTETILVVEDDEAVRRYVVSVLCECGYDVMDAPDARQAVSLSEKYEWHIDLLLTGMVTSAAGGDGLVDQLRRNRPNLKVLYTSGYRDGSVRPQDLQKAAVAFLRKPFSQDELYESVRELLDQPSPDDAVPV